MMPVYMDPSQPCQMRPQGYYSQGFGNNSQHMKMDAPPPCHGSCVHGNFPAYNAYWPPCYPPQVPYHQCCMNHSGFHPPHGAYAPPCYTHPPFPVGYQQPWYDTEKDVPGKHQCGKCSPQICNMKKDRGVVIEEHEPEIDKGNQGEAVLPVRSTNCRPYPVIWIPHENAWNQEQGSSLGSGNHNQPHAEVKAPENMMVQKFFPKSWNGYFPFDESTMKSMVQNQDMQKAPNGKSFELPFDISKLKSLLQGQDMKGAEIQNNTKESGQLPYSIFWIPSRGEREDVEASESKENSNEGGNLEPCLSDLHGNEVQKTQNEGKEGNFECNVLSDAEEKSSVRNIPVENHQQEPRNISVKLSENHLPKPTEPPKKIEKNEQVKNTKKQQSSSSSKPFRLPPVCLRVDPLPKKRNGGSKSPSTPKQKEESSIMSEETKVTSPLRSKKAESSTLPESCSVKCEEANKEMKMCEGSLDAIATEKESVESNSNLQEGSNCEIVKPCETKENREQPAKKTFTEDEAARIIQSRYRGYDVRRWEPVKKLKEIANIRGQMGDVKKRIQALQVSTDQHVEEKEIVVIEEMVMNLLLKLDAVEGLHPSIRDYRKSLARDLSGIQEKLDSLKNSSAIAEKEAVKDQMEISSQPCDSPVNLEHSRRAEENKMVFDSNTENVEEHPMGVLSRTDEQPAEPAVEAEERSGLFKTLATDPEQATENEADASSTTIPEKIGEVETVVLINPLSADGNGMTVTNIKENKTVVESLEEPVNELPQVVEETDGTSSTQDLENATEVSEAEANASENEDRKGDDDTVLPSENDVELSELPVGVIEDETQLTSSHDSSSCNHEAKITAMDPETANQEETDVDHSPDNSKGTGQETSEPQEEKEQPPETEVIVEEQPLETGVVVKEQPPETEVTEHEIPEETKKLIEENQRFKETMETLVKAGREQLEVISKLTSRVKSLEKKLSHKKKQTRRRRVTKPMSTSSA